MEEEVTKLLRSIIEALVDIPESVEISMNTSDAGVLWYSVHCAKEDVGKVIGRQGRNIESVRQIIMSMAARYKRKIILEVVE